MLENLAKSRAALDRRTIVQAALNLLDEVGIEGLSTRRLAAELGVKGPSLYWHFKNKNELLAHMSGALFLEALPEPDFDSADFNLDTWLADGAHGLRRTALSRRDGALVMTRIPPVVTDEKRAFSEMSRCLHVRSGMPLKDCSVTLLSLGRYAMGWALYENATPRHNPEPDWDSDFQFGLETFLKGLRARMAATKG